MAECLLEPFDVDGMSVLGCDHLREIEREAVCVVELERILAGNHRLMAQLLHAGEPSFDRLEETLFFGARDALDVRFLRRELRINLPHHAGHRARERRERRLAPAQEPGVTDRAAQNAPQDVAAPLVGRIDTIGQQERDGARVVGEHAIGSAGGTVIIGPPHDLDRVRDNRLKEIGIEVGRHVLHHRGDALEAGSGIHRGLGQILPRPVGLQVVLHKDEVPDLELLPLLVQAHELFCGELTPAALGPGTQVHVQLGVGPGRTGIGHLPEVVLVPETENAAVGDAGDLPPQLARFIVGVVHRDVEAVGIDAEPLITGHPVPRVFDRFLLEIVAEGEVAEHLEERVVACRVADLLQVVVLPARADALLAGHRTRVVATFQALKHPLELHHSGVGEQQRGVIGRYERPARHLLVGPG